LADGVGVEEDGGEGLEEGRQADAGAGAVEALEKLLAGEGTRAEAGGAADVGAGGVPAVALGLGEKAAPTAKAVPRRGAGLRLAEARC